MSHRLERKLPLQLSMKSKIFLLYTVRHAQGISFINIVDFAKRNIVDKYSRFCKKNYIRKVSLKGISILPLKSIMW